MYFREITEAILILATLVHIRAIFIHWQIGKQTGWIWPMTIYCIIYATMLIPRFSAQLELYQIIGTILANMISAGVMLFDSTALNVSGKLFAQMLERQAARIKVGVEKEIALNAASDVVIWLDDHGTITEVNEAVTRVLGFSKESLMGKNITTIMPHRFRPKHRVAFDNYKKTGEKSMDWSGVKVAALTAWGNGAEVPVEISFAEFRIGDEQRFIGILRRFNGDKNG